MKTAEPSVKNGSGVKVEREITIRVPVQQLYAFWRQLENLPRFMNHLESVTQTDARRSHWKVKGPAGKVMEWDAEIIEDRQPELISWRSLPGADVDNAGSVWFQPAGPEGTRVKVALKYDPPGGKAGAAIAKLFGRDAARDIQRDLTRLRDLLEGRTRGAEAA